MAKKLHSLLSQNHFHLFGISFFFGWCGFSLKLVSLNKIINELSLDVYPFLMFALGIIILPLSVGWIEEDPFTVNIFITLIYATVSFVRIYFLRRIFEKIGFDDNFIRLGIKYGKSLTNSIRNISTKE